MPTQLAVFLFLAGICGLLLLDRDRRFDTSKALWISVVVLLFNASRAPSEWLDAFGFGPAQAISSDPFVDGTPLDRNILTLLMVSCIVVLAGRMRRVNAILRHNRLLVLFFAYCGLSVLWSDYPFVAFKRWVKGTSDVLFVMLILTEHRPGESLVRVLTRLTFILVPLSVLFIKYCPELGRRYDYWSSTPIIIGVSTTKNELGMVCLICGTFSLWRFLALYSEKASARRSRGLISHCAILVMVLWLFHTADSMTSLACFLTAGSLLTIAMFSRTVRCSRALHVLVLATLAVTGSVVFLDSGGWLISAMGRDPTLTGRTNIWQAVLASATNPWVGTGFETFWAGPRLESIWARTMPGLNQAHNGYIEVYLNLGLIGVGFLCGLVMRGYRNVAAGLRSGDRTAGLKLALFILAIMFNFTEAGFRETTLVWICFVYVVMSSNRMILSTLGQAGSESFVTDGVETAVGQPS